MSKQNLVPFKGNCPRNVAKDAKYAVRLDHGRYVVGLVYRAPENERWYPVASDHEELTEMVNAVKTAATGSLGGAFYINEFNQVIVPTAGDEAQYYVAGEYTRPLMFQFEGHILSGKPPEGLLPGDEWTGVHPGIPYVLAAGGKDIYYETQPRPRVVKRVQLSEVRSPNDAQRLAKWITQVKGGAGGRFYVNEFRAVFAPLGTTNLRYVYVGLLNDPDAWFPKPEPT